MTSLCLLYIKYENAAVPGLMITAVGQIADDYCSLLATGKLQQLCVCVRLRPWSGFVLHWLTVLCTCSPHRAQTMSHMLVMWAITFPKTTPVWPIMSPDKVGTILHDHSRTPSISATDGENINNKAGDATQWIDVLCLTGSSCVLRASLKPVEGSVGSIS